MQSPPAMPRVSKRRAYITVVILFLINLLNYMDRLTVAGELVYVVVIGYAICSFFVITIKTSHDYFETKCFKALLPSLIKIFFIFAIFRCWMLCINCLRNIWTQCRLKTLLA